MNGLLRTHRVVLFWIGAGILVGGILLVLLVVLSALGRAGVAQASPTPVVTIFPNPTSTATLPATNPPPEPTLEPATATPGPNAGQGFAVGDYVEVFGTGGDGLRVRVTPGLSASVQYVAVESEVFEVRAGPQEADGQTWWFLANPNDPSKNGWAVGEYLRSIGPR